MPFGLLYSMPSNAINTPFWSLTKKAKIKFYGKICEIAKNAGNFLNLGNGWLALDEVLNEPEITNEFDAVLTRTITADSGLQGSVLIQPDWCVMGLNDENTVFNISTELSKIKAVLIPDVYEKIQPATLDIKLTEQDRNDAETLFESLKQFYSKAASQKHCVLSQIVL